MNPISAAVIKAGLLSPNMLQEMKRLSPAIDQELEAAPPVDLDTAAKIVGDALQSEDAVAVRETDLEVLQQYTDTATSGSLHIEVEGKAEDFPVTFGRTPVGELIVAWRGESIRDLLTNGVTYLQTDANKVFFSDVRELFFGEQKAFMVCTVSVAEPL